MFDLAMRRVGLPRRIRFVSLALRVAALAVLVVGLARAGSVYFVCAAMDVISSAPCCPHCAPAGGEAEAPVVDRAPCCARDHVRALPSATTADAVAVHDAPLLATLDPVSLGDMIPQARALVRARTSGRTGPPPRDTRATRLMVFLL